MVTKGLPLRFAGPSTTGITNFFQGALGAGGYASSIIMASDGSAMTLRNDTAMPWLWLRSTNKWRNAATTPGMNTQQATTPLEMVFAPSNPNRMYMVYIAPLPVQGAAGGGFVERNYLWRSDDKGVNWIRPNTTVAFCGANPPTTGNPLKYCGPRMAVDPNNPDVVYIMSITGTVYVSYDAGVTISVVSGLLAALPSAVVNGSAPTSGSSSFTVVSNPIDGLASQDWYAFDPTWPLALGNNASNDHVVGSSGTTITVQVLQARDGGTGSASIAVGDTIYFGRVGGICVDSSADTIANPGGSGVISKTVYCYWQLGATNVWRTMNGGGNWAAMTGGPASATCKMKMSNDGALAGGGFNTNILYVCPAASNIWRYVENPPTGSGLAAQTWTQVTSGLTATILATTSHPTLAGHAAAINIGGGLFVTSDFGTTWGGGQPGTGLTIVPGPPGIPPNGTDTTWLQDVSDFSMGDCEYDIGSGSTPGKIWLADGIGVLWTQTTANFTSTITAITKDATGATFTLGANDWIQGMSFIVSGIISGMTQANGVRFYIQSTSGGGTTIKTNVDSSAWGTFSGTATASFGNTLVAQSAGMDSLTTQMMLKAPAPNGRVLIACQDRQIFSAADVNTYPTGYWPPGVSNPTGLTYSKSDPTVVWACTNAALVKSTDSGQSATTTVNANGGWGMVASTTPMSCFLVKRPFANGGGNIAYTADGGTNWTDSLFAGSVLEGTSFGPLGGANSFWAVCDDFSNYYYWRQAGFVNGITGITNDATGATFTLPGTWAPGQSFVPGGINAETLSVSGITLDATGAVITLSSTTNLTVGMTFVVNGVSTTIQANGVTFTITSITPTGGLTAGQVKTNVNSSAWTAYGSGGGSAAIHNNMTQANGVTFTITSVGSGTVKTNIDSSTFGTYISGSGGFVSYAATFWKSTDGGANFVLKSTTPFNPGQGTSDGSTFCCPPGINGDIWFCPGAEGSYIFKVLGYVSTDSGATWTAMNQAGDPQNLYHIAFGKAKPGGVGYPAAYMSGFMTDPSTGGLFRCDDPKNAARVWTPINGFRNVDPEGDRYLTADIEEYGTVYQATYSTGYVYGKIS